MSREPVETVSSMKGTNINIAAINVLDGILTSWQSLLGEDFQGYRNHCVRMMLCCFTIKLDCSEDERLKIAIAAAFHDIGIWINDTVDYIPPSIPPAEAYLESIGKTMWLEEIRLMISEHHKVTAYENSIYPLVEVFRKGDLMDFSFGCVRFGVSKETLRTIRAEFPNAGFHKMLLRRAAKWFVKHPFNPAPMMKW